MLIYTATKISITRICKLLLFNKITKKKTILIGKKPVLCARYSSPPLRQKRSPLHTNFFAALCHPPF